MKTYKLYTTIVLTLFLFGNIRTAVAQNEKALLSAIQEEVDRNLSSLRLENMRAPFFISYTIHDRQALFINSSLGSLLESRITSGRRGSPYLLVGDYQFSSGNYDGNAYFSPPAPFPIEDDAKGIARAIWRELDPLYKTHAKGYESKAAAIRKQSLKKEILNLPDYTQVAPAECIQPRPSINKDKKYWEKYAKKASATFQKYPELSASNLYISIVDIMSYTYNTEGTRMALPRPTYCIGVRMSILGNDGQFLTDGFQVKHSTFEQMPDVEAFMAQCDTFIQEFINLSKAPSLEDSYYGPVLFEGGAVADIFRNNFFVNGGALTAHRTRISDHGRGGGFYANLNMEAMLGKKMMDTKLNISSMSGTKSWKGETLDGYFPYDVEGVAPAEELPLIENGILRNLLTSRIPTLRLRESNGHARYNNPSGNQLMAGNVRVYSTETCDYETLKQQFIEAIRAEGNEYGFIIRSSSRVYRIYVEDGREELVKNASFNTFNRSTFRRIMGATEESALYTYEWIDDLMDTYIVPKALLIEELEIKAENQPETRKPYIVPAP